MKEQKLVYFTNTSVGNINEKYIANGWRVVNITSTAWGNSSICYVLLEKDSETIITG